MHRVERRGASSERGYNAKWRKFRAAFLREHPLCEYCAADGRIRPAEVVDHDVPHRNDPDRFWATTFTALCEMHHRGEKRRIEASLPDDEIAAWVRRRKERPS